MTPQIEYRWRYDADYYATLIERYYRQLPLILQLPTQFTVVWLVGLVVFSAATGESLREFGGWALLIGAIGIPASVLLTKKAILLKYRIRPSFGSEASYSMSETGITIHAKSLQGTYP